MQREWLTEYEWRTAQRKKRRPDWWGAQCVYPTGMKRVMQNRHVQRRMAALAMLMAILLLIVHPVRTLQSFDDLPPMDQTAFSARSVNAIAYSLPEDLEYIQHVFPRGQLVRGKMLMINQQYQLPDDLPPPNTASIALRGNGMIPVRSLSIRAGYETIEALRILFDQLRSEGVEGLYVQQGTMSYAQQSDATINQMRSLMQQFPPEQAAALVRQQTEMPGVSSLLLEYAVEIGTPDEKSLENTLQGQKLMQLCWRYGFVRESKERPFRFRYVGKAHAAAMTYLDVDLASYLEWLHQKGKLVVYAGGKPQYLILCQPMEGDYAAFDLPVGVDYEVSLDNTGYALAACTL